MAAVVKLGPRNRLTPLRPVFHPLARTAKRLQDRQFQKRRVAVARSMAANSQTLSTERPFNPHDFPVPDTTSPPPPTFSTFFFPPPPRQSQSPTPAPDQLISLRQPAHPRFLASSSILRSSAISASSARRASSCFRRSSNASYRSFDTSTAFSWLICPGPDNTS